MKKILKQLIMTSHKKIYSKEKAYLLQLIKYLTLKNLKNSKKTQIQDLKERWVEDAATINYLDDINIDDLKENKNLKLAAKKTSDKYRKLRKRRASTKIPESQKLVAEFAKQTKQHF